MFGCYLNVTVVIFLLVTFFNMTFEGRYNNQSCFQYRTITKTDSDQSNFFRSRLNSKKIIITHVNMKTFLAYLKLQSMIYLIWNK